VATKHGNHDPILPESHHEVSDVSPKPIFFFAMGLVVLILLTLISMKGLFNLLDQDADRSDPQLSGVASERPKLPPLPRLETDPVAARKQYFQNEKMLIESYGWVDQKQGIVRVPIKRAMELLVERGFPVRAEAKVNPSSERSREPGKLEAERSPAGK
jgi:hypothetical protein